MGDDYLAGTGIFSTTNTFTDENVEDIGPNIHYRWGAKYPLMGMMNKKSVSNYRFDVRRSNLVATEYTCAAAGASAAGTLQVLTLTAASDIGLDGVVPVTSGVSSKKIVTGDILMSKETMAVYRASATIASGAAGNFIVLTTGSSAAVTASDTFVKIGSAALEGADIGTIVLPVIDRFTNFTQITRTIIGLSNTQAQSEQAYGSELVRQKNFEGREHMRKLEMSSWFSTKTEDVVTSVRTTAGIIEQLSRGVLSSTNGTDIAGVLTEANFNDAMDTAFTATNTEDEEKVLWCSRTVLRAITNFGLDRLVLDTITPAAIGMKVYQYVLPWGSIRLVLEPWFSHTADRSGTYDLTAGLAILLNMSDIKFVYLNGRNTQLKTNIQGNGEDLYKEELLTEWGIEMGLNEEHYAIFGVTG